MQLEYRSQSGNTALQVFQNPTTRTTTGLFSIATTHQAGPPPKNLPTLILKWKAIAKIQLTARKHQKRQIQQQSNFKTDSDC